MEARQARGLSNFTIHVNKYKFSEVIFEFENPGPVTTHIIITTMPITKQQSTTAYCHQITDLNQTLETHAMDLERERMLALQFKNSRTFTAWRRCRPLSRVH